MSNLHDIKTVLITGASSGIGKQIAIGLGKNKNNKLILLARREDKLKQLVEEIKENVIYRVVDINSHDHVRDIIKDFPNVDVLINNAGLALENLPFAKNSFEDINTVINTNILGLVNITHAILPSMIGRKQGLIINIGSVAGNYAYPGSHVYGATKAFVEQFTLNLRSDLLGDNIRVSLIAPGTTETEFSLVRYKGDKEKSQKLYRSITPLSAEDIYKTVEFIMSLPQHVNINKIEIMPTDQAFNNFLMNTTAR